MSHVGTEGSQPPGAAHAALSPLRAFLPPHGPILSPSLGSTDLGATGTSGLLQNTLSFFSWWTFIPKLIARFFRVMFSHERDFFFIFGKRKKKKRHEKFKHFGVFIS